MEMTPTVQVTSTARRRAFDTTPRATEPTFFLFKTPDSKENATKPNKITEFRVMEGFLFSFGPH